MTEHLKACYQVRYPPQAQVCYVVLAFGFPPAFLFRAAISSLTLGRPTFPPGEGFGRTFTDLPLIRVTNYELQIEGPETNNPPVAPGDQLKILYCISLDARIFCIRILNMLHSANTALQHNLFVIYKMLIDLNQQP